MNPANNPPVFSRVTLGTVQFGLNYGIANTQGKPDYETCRAILEAALEANIYCFDTAASYGESEKVLGRALHELGAADRAMVISKSRPIKRSDLSPREVESLVEASLLQSLRNLGLECLPLFLFHSEEDLGWMEAMDRLKQRGLVRHIGVSIDSKQGAYNALDAPLAEAIQIPFNLLDHRFSEGSFFEQAQQQKLWLFARSAFLQGLLLMPEEKIPAHLGEVLPVRRELQTLASTAGMGMPELCLRYSLSFPAITSVLIGVDTVSQLRENASMIQRGPLEPGLLAQIQNLVPEFPESILRPSLWSK